MGKEGSMRYEEIKQLIDLFEETDLAEMELTRENDGLRLVRGNAGRTVSQPAAVAQPEYCGIGTERSQRSYGR